MLDSSFRVLHLPTPGATNPNHFVPLWVSTFFIFLFITLKKDLERPLGLLKRDQLLHNPLAPKALPVILGTVYGNRGGTP